MRLAVVHSPLGETTPQPVFACIYGTGWEGGVEEVSLGLGENLQELVKQVCKMCATFLTDDKAYGR